MRCLLLPPLLALVGCTAASASVDAGAPGDATNATDRSTPVIDAGPTPDVTMASDVPRDVPPPDVRADALSADATAANVGLAALLSRDSFERYFPHRADTAAGCSGALYTYDNLLAASLRYPRFLADGTLDERRRELAAFLANASHETTGGWAAAPDGPESWGLCFREEVGCAREAPPACAYCVASTEWPCAAGARYYGRGPLQLSYNYNYGPCGRALGVDLLAHPELVATDGAVAFAAALWFWMTPQAPKPSCHDVMTGAWTPAADDLAAGRRPGFGMTINVINGGLECSHALEALPRAAPDNVQDRVRFYQHFAQALGVAPGDAVDCGSQRHY